MHRITKSLRSITAALAILMSAAAIAACGGASDKGASAPPTYSVDAAFREFYERLGGLEVLGPAISDPREVDQYRVQFTSSSLLVHDPLAPPESRFFLAPLGLEFDVAESSLPLTVKDSERYRDGHYVHEEFWEIYNRLQGFSGPPLTEGRYNPEKARLEQYFANLGFYIPDSDPDRRVHLMDYGGFKCDRYCRYRSHPSAIPSLIGVVPEPFASSISRLGSGLTGRALTGASTAPDGQVEVIFDNLVLTTDPSGSGRVGARPIVEALNIQPHPLVPRIDDRRMDFYPITADLGHNIPVIFTDYLAQHGSLEISGPPITEVYLYDQNQKIYRQCFTNLCLDYYHAPTPEEAFIRPAPLGLVYKNKFYSLPSGGSPDSQNSPNSLNLKVWEDFPLLAPDQPQRILAGVFAGEAPLPGVAPDLTVSYPDGSEKVYFFPATGGDGITALQLPPVTARNGTLIPYEVCLQNVDSSRFCVGDEFLIWGN
ncbi:MAG TPA: hypothetical protein VJ768_04325 [Anaerolineales bacterium]|nr:hypothetical protein [Anaerolineales bacterium]